MKLEFDTTYYAYLNESAFKYYTSIFAYLEGGGPEFRKTCLYNTCTLPYDKVWGFQDIWEFSGPKKSYIPSEFQDPMGIPVGARILMRYENSNGVWDIQHLIGIPIIVPKSHWGSGDLLPDTCFLIIFT